MRTVLSLDKRHMGTTGLLIGSGIAEVAPFFGSRGQCSYKDVIAPRGCELRDDS